jgi:hypothetical protein
MTLTSIIHREPQGCIILDLRCENCGPVRLAIGSEEPTPDQMACPYCDALSIATLLGYGSTRRILPYFDLAPNHANLEQLQVLSANCRPLARGQIVCFSEEPDIYHFAKIEDVYTNRAHISSAGRPAVSFLIANVDTGPIPHITGAETRPWWCWTDELPKTEQAMPEKKAVRKAKKGNYVVNSLKGKS